MKHLYEYTVDNQVFVDLNEYLAEQLDEGWVRDKARQVKDLIGKVFNYLKGTVAKIGAYFFNVSDGEIDPVVNPLMGQQAWLDGKIPDGKCMMWVGTKDDKKYVKNPTSAADVIKSRGSSLAYWSEAASRIAEGDEMFTDEEKMLLEKIELKNEDDDIWGVDSAELESEIRACIKNPVNHKPLLIYGAPGVGKTQIVKSVLKETMGADAGFLDFQLSLKEHDDFFLPTYNIDKTATVDVPKSYLPVYKPTGDAAKDAELDSACGRGLIFLDELSQARPQVQAVMLKLVNERVLGEEYKLGSGWAIVSASNRDADEVGGHELNKALLNRFDVVNYEPTVKSWRRWADQKAYMNKHVLDWLEIHTEYFYWNKDGSNMIATPRAWEGACRRLAEFAHTAEDEGFRLEQIPDRVIEKSIAMGCGRSVANLFMEYVKLLRLVDLEALKKVFTDPDKAPLPDTKHMDQMYIFCSYIVSMLEKIPTKEEWTNLMKYAVRLKNESGASRLCWGLVQRFPDINYGFKGLQNSSTHDTYTEGMMVLIDGYPEWNNSEDVFTSAQA